MGNCFTALAELGAGTATGKFSALTDSSTDNSEEHIAKLEEQASVLTARIAALDTERDGLVREARAVVQRSAAGPKRTTALRRIKLRKDVIEQQILDTEKQHSALEGLAMQMRNVRTSVQSARLLYDAACSLQQQMPSSRHEAVLAGVEQAGEELTRGHEFRRELTEVTSRALRAGTAGREPADLTEDDLMRELGIAEDGEVSRDAGATDTEVASTMAREPGAAAARAPVQEAAAGRSRSRFDVAAAEAGVGGGGGFSQLLDEASTA